VKTLKDKTAVITGAGSGIGRGIALALAGAGANVVVADISSERALDVADEVRARGVRGLAETCDVAKPDSVAKLAERAYAEFGAVDILCNNAGVTGRPHRNISEVSLEDWQFILGINLWGVLHGLTVFLPRMRRQSGEKHIVNTASFASLFPLEGIAPYCAGKAAVASLSETMARELAPHGFGVTILCPGPVRTNIAANSTQIRGEAPGSQRQFEPVDSPLIDRMMRAEALAPEAVGIMVRNAILANRLYVHTHVLPMDLVADRVYTLFGPGTLGET
jgi:NAD(P)-dependent dehydrogenase (short-subunit alcohol dehydrogenase family)